MLAVSVAKLTVTSVTPLTRRRTRSTLLEQEAQVMPVILSDILVREFSMRHLPLVVLDTPAGYTASLALPVMSVNSVKKRVPEGTLVRGG